MAANRNTIFRHLSEITCHRYPQLQHRKEMGIFRLRTYLHDTISLNILTILKDLFVCQYGNGWAPILETLNCH